VKESGMNIPSITNNYTSLGKEIAKLFIIFHEAMRKSEGEDWMESDHNDYISNLIRKKCPTSEFPYRSH